MQQVVRRHAAAFVLAALVGIIAIAPYLYFSATTSTYAGIALTGQDAEEYYVARIHEVYEGDLSVGNAFLPYKQVPYITPALGEDIVAGLGKILGVSATTINILTKFLFPFFVFVAIYALGFSLSRSRFAAALASTLAMLGGELMSYPLDLLHLLSGTSFLDGLYWSRPINPEVSGLFLFVALLLIYRAYCLLENPRTYQVILTGALTGASLYISIYIWLFLGGLLLILLVWKWHQREFAQAKSVFTAGCIALLGAIPFVLNYLQYKNFAGYANAAGQQGALHSHAPVFGVWVFVLLLIPFFIRQKELESGRIFFIACALSLMIVLNQQVITGIYLQPGHFHWYVTKPLIGVLLGVYGFILARRYISRAWLMAGISIVIAVLFVHSALAQVYFYKLHSPQSVQAQNYAPVLAYLNSLSPQVVFTHQNLSNVIPLYTNDDAPRVSLAGVYIAPEDYWEKILFLKYRLRGIRPEDAWSIMHEERQTILTDLYGAFYAQVFVQMNTTEDTTLAALARDYAAYYPHPIAAMMKDTGVTLLIEDTATEPWRVASTSPDITKIKSVSGRFIFYKASAQ